MDEGGTTTKAIIYCRGCGYDLRESSLRCPECGRAFDRADPKSYYASPRSRRVRWAKRILWLLLLVALPPAIGLGWLWWGWHEEQQHVAAMTWAGWKGVRVQPVYSWLPKCMPDRWAHLADRVDGVSSPSRLASESPLRNVAELSRLRSAALSYAALADEHLRHLRGLSQLEELVINGASITDEGLVHLAGLSRLQKLDLWNTSITGPGLRHLKLLRLQRLSLFGSPLDDAALAHLSGMGELRMLDLSRTPITDAGLVHLAGLTQLRVLKMNDTKVGDDGLRLLAGMRNLHWLAIDGTAITDAGLEHLKSLRNLRYLELMRTRISRLRVCPISDFTRRLGSGTRPLYLWAPGD